MSFPPRPRQTERMSAAVTAYLLSQFRIEAVERWGNPEIDIRCMRQGCTWTREGYVTHGQLDLLVGLALEHEGWHADNAG